MADFLLGWGWDFYCISWYLTLGCQVSNAGTPLKFHRWHCGAILQYSMKRARKQESLHHIWESARFDDFSSFPSSVKTTSCWWRIAILHGCAVKWKLTFSHWSIINFWCLFRQTFEVYGVNLGGTVHRSIKHHISLQLGGAVAFAYNEHKLFRVGLSSCL